MKPINEIESNLKRRTLTVIVGLLAAFCILLFGSCFIIVSEVQRAWDNSSIFKDWCYCWKELYLILNSFLIVSR